MKKILQINTTIGYASPGKIANDIGDLLLDHGFESYIAYGRPPESKSQSKVIRIGNNIDNYTHVLSTRVLDNHCFSSKKATKRLVAQIKHIKPDLIQIHNLHGYYININVLFNYLKKLNIPITWTFHDAWAITGHCTHFENIGCEKWKTLCHTCPQTKEYPSSYIIDRSRKNYLEKKELFNSLSNLTIITPSFWLSNLVKQSHLSKIKIKTVANGVDQLIFKPRITSSIKEKLGLSNNFIVLAVSSVWNKQKGYDDFMELSSKMEQDCTLVMVGLNSKQFENLPSNIIGVKRTTNVEELSELYSLADVFVNLTYADTFPTTNLESLSCGTPVITYKTGGSIESVTPETGFIVEQGNLNAVLDSIKLMKKEGKQKYYNASISLAKEKYNKAKQYSEYINLYKSLLDKK